MFILLYVIMLSGIHGFLPYSFKPPVVVRGKGMYVKVKYYVLRVCCVEVSVARNVYI